MRRFIFELVWFLIIFLLLIVPLVFFIASFDNLDKDFSTNSNIITLQTKSQYDSLDILFLGNSYCYSAIQPSILLDSSLNTFNLGVASAGVEFYDLIVKDYLSNIKQYPKEVFILVSPMTFSGLADNNLLYPFHRYLETPISNFSFIFTKRDFDKLVPIYRKSFIKGLTNLFIRKNNTERINTTNRGFVSNDQVVNEKIIKNNEHLYIQLLEEVLNNKKVNKLEELVSFLENNGIKVTFFEIPTYKLNEFFSPDYLEEYDLVLSKLKVKNDLFKLDSTLFSPENYRNIDHMNNSGSVIATKELIRYIKSNR